MAIDSFALDDIIQLITARTGIIPRASHREGIKTYIEKMLLEKDFLCKVIRMLL